jgi:hypothetical protein
MILDSENTAQAGNHIIRVVSLESVVHSAIEADSTVIRTSGDF